MTNSSNAASELNFKIPWIIAKLSMLFPDQIENDKWEEFLSQRTDQEIDALEDVLWKMEWELFNPKQIIPNDLQKITYNYLPIKTKSSEELPLLDAWQLSQKVDELLDTPLLKLLKMDNLELGKIIVALSQHEVYSTIVWWKKEIKDEAKLWRDTKKILIRNAQDNIKTAQQFADAIYSAALKLGVIRY